MRFLLLCAVLVLCSCSNRNQPISSVFDATAIGSDESVLVDRLKTNAVQFDATTQHGQTAYGVVRASFGMVTFRCVDGKVVGKTWD
jgi:hypothetical protein